MSLQVNSDGKLLSRIVGAGIPASIGLVIAGIVWWRDTSNSTLRASENLARLETRLDRVEAEARELRNTAAEDRRKTAEISVKISNVERGVVRIEALLDKWNGQGYGGPK